MASVNITVSQYLSHGFNPSDTVTILDTSTNLAGLQASDIAQLVANGVEFINASDDVLSWNVAQWQAVPSGVGFDVSDFKVVADTGAHLAGLSTTDLANLNTYGVTLLSPQDAVLSFSVAQYQALGGISVDQDADVTLSDTGSALQNLTAAQIGALAIKGFDVIDASNDSYHLTSEQANALAGVTLDASDTVTLLDTAENIENMNAAQFAAVGDAGVSILDSSDNHLTLQADEVLAISGHGLSFTGADSVALYDTGAHIGALSATDLANLNSIHLDRLDASDDALTLSLAKLQALGSIALTGSDTVTLADTGANLAGISAGNYSVYGGAGVDIIDATDNAVSLTVAQLDSMAGNGVHLTAADTVTLADSTTNIAALSAGELGGFFTQGVDVIDAISGTGAYSISAATAISGLTFASDDTVTLADTGANISALTSTQVGALKAHGIDAIDASDNAFSLSLAQFNALNGVTLTGGDTVTLADTDANLAGLSVSAIGGLSAAGIDTLDATDNTLGLSLAQYNALGAVALTGADTVTVSASGASLAGLNAGVLAAMGEKGVDYVDATDNALIINANQANVLALGGEIHLTLADTVTLGDTGAHIAAFSNSDFFFLGQGGVDVLDASDNSLNLTVSQMSGVFAGLIAFTDADNVVTSDTAANLDFLVAGDIDILNLHKVDSINATDAGVYSFDALAARAFLNGTVFMAADDNTALADTGANIAGLLATQLSGLHAYGFDAINATDDVLSLTVDQYDNLNGLNLTHGDTVTLADTGANIAALSASVLGGLGAAEVDNIDATDDVLNLTVAQWEAFWNNGSGEAGLTGADTVTLVDTGANLGGLTTTELAALGSDNVDALDASDNAISFTIAQLNALTANLTSQDLVSAADTQANIQALTAGQILTLSTKLVDLLDVSDTNTLAVNANQAQAVAQTTIGFADGDAVTLTDTGANIAALAASDFSALVVDGLDTIDASDNALNLSVAQYRAIAGSATHLTGADTVTLVDTGANLASLSAIEIAALAANNVDRLNASDNVLKLNVAQFNALGAVTLAGGDVVSLLDTGAHLATLNFSSLAGKNVDLIDATDNVLTLSYSQFSSLGAVSLAAGDTVTLADTSAVIEGLTGSQMLSLGGKGIDVIDTTDNVLHLNLTQFNNLGAVVLASNDVVTIADTEAHLDNVSGGKINALNAAGVDFIDATDGTWKMSAAAAGALADGSAKATAADAVSVFDTGANIAGLTAGEIGALGAHNVDAIDASDDTVSLTTGQFNALGSVTLTGADVVTLSDTGSLLASMNFATLNAKGVDVLDATDDAVNITVAQFRALGDLTFDNSDTVTLRDTGANIQAMSAAEIATLDDPHDVAVIDSTTDLLNLSVDQFNALGEISLTSADLVTIVDTSANLAGLTLAFAVAKGVDRIDASDNQLTLTKAQVDQIAGHVALTQTDTVTMTASENAIEGLTAGQLASYAAQGVDVLDAANNVLFLAADQVAAMANTGLKAAADDFVTLTDSSADIIANLGALFGSLGAAGVDKINLTDDAINLTVDQGMDLLNGAVVFNSNDTGVTILDSSANIEALDASALAGLTFIGVDRIDATDDVLHLSAGQYGGFVLQGGALTGSDDVSLADLGANIALFSQAQIKQLAANGIDQVTLTDHQITLNYGQYKSFTHDFAFSSLDTVTAKGTEGNNSLTGGDEKDIFDGRGGNDTIDGGRGADTITGGLGSDVLTGGIGSDHFVFTSLADSTVGAADRITDLTNIDVIDLSLIDADSTVDGDQAFHEVKKFTGHAGEMMVKYSSGSGLTLIKLDVDGDGHADAQIAIDGDHHSFDNFVL